RGGRRGRVDRGHARCLAAARRVRRLRQVLPPRGRRVRHLRTDGRPPAPLSRRAAPGRAMTAAAAVRLPGLRWHPAEIVFWVAAAAVVFVFPRHLVLGSQVLITGLFALSLDLILGYAGIVSLGHAAMFGAGAYTAGLLAKHGW